MVVEVTRITMRICYCSIYQEWWLASGLCQTLVESGVERLCEQIPVWFPLSLRPRAY